MVVKECKGSKQVKPSYDVRLREISAEETENTEDWVQNYRK